MPALQYHLLNKRLESGTTFSIIFGVVAAVVIVACALWGIALPEYHRNRGRKRPPSTPTIRWNTGSILTTRKRSKFTRTYPSHPAVRPLLSKPSAAQIVSTYNPRTESPFPDGPAFPMISFSKTRANSTPPLATSVSSNGLFTPVKRSSSGDDESKSKYHTVPRAAYAKHLAIPSSDFGDAKDFILAVPEPLALKPRDAGRPPAVVRHLQKFGFNNTASPMSSDKHLHPNKLFRAVQKADVRNSFCSGTSMRVDHRHSDTAKDISSKDSFSNDESVIQEDPSEISYRSYKDTVSSGPGEEVSTPAPKASNNLDSHDQDLAMVHRLRSYQSLTAGHVPKPSRAGIITRSNTPVEELRKLYAREERNAAGPSTQPPSTGRLSTLLTSTEVGSDFGSISTPATSPAFPPSNSNLLPYPLHVKKSFEPGSVRESGISNPFTIGTSVFGESSHDVTSTIETDDQRCDNKGTRGFYHAGRRLTKPPPLDIRRDVKAPPSDTGNPRRSFTEFSHAVFGPLIKANGMRSRARASSMYSRDTHGISMVNTPVTPDFPTPASEVFPDRSVSSNQVKSQDSVKARIDEWTRRVEGNIVPPLPQIRHVSPMLKWSNTLAEEESEEAKAQDATTGELPSPNGSPLNQNNRRDGNYAPGGAVWI